MAVKVGIGLFTGEVMPGSERTFHREYREVIEMACLAETLGFESAWVSEHHGAGDGYLASLLPMLSAIAARTSRIHLGTGVMLTPFHDPLRLAEDAAFVDQLSGGRLILGLGLGWREEEFRMFGVEQSERLRRTTETVEILRRAWTGERFSFEGRHFAYDRIQVTPRPFLEAGVPIYIGGMSDRAVERAGRIGDGYIRTRSHWNTWPEAVALAERGARAAGKDAAALGYAQLQNAFPWDDAESGWELIRRGAAHHLGVYAGWGAGSDTPGTGVLHRRDARGPAALHEPDRDAEGDRRPAPPDDRTVPGPERVPLHRAAPLSGDVVRDGLARDRAVRRAGPACAAGRVAPGATARRSRCGVRVWVRLRPTRDASR